MPEDARIAVAVDDRSERTVAVQGQVVLNRVQGTPYPYFYCVVLARKGAGLDRVPLPHTGGDPVFERKSEADFDVLVVRQKTTATSGYATTAAFGASLLCTSLRIARAVAGR